MKRLNSYCRPFTLKAGCIMIALANVFNCKLVFTYLTSKIAKNGGVKEKIEIVELPWLVISAVIYLSLLFGAIMGKRKYLLPSLVAFVVEIFHLVYLAITEFDADPPDDKKLPEVYRILLVVPFAILVFGLFVYFWMVVWSHYMELWEVHQGSSDCFGMIYRPKSPTPVNVNNV